MILDGNIVAENIYQGLARGIKELKATHIQPFLATIMVGENPVSLNFIKIKEKAARNLGIDFKIYQFPNDVRQRSILDLIEELNNDKFTNGIIVQLPLPKGFNAEEIIEIINPQKDVDGLLGKYPAPTAAGIIELLKYYKIDYQNKKIVIVGHGRLVGEPLAKMLTAQGCEPLVGDLQTENLKEKTLSADILISATGVPGLIKAGMVSEKAIVIDAGTAESGGKIIGDVEPAIYQKVQSYTPTPGGVGPVTVACLFRNLFEASKDKNE